jgi:hypothetical protein
LPGHLARRRVFAVLRGLAFSGTADDTISAFG